MTNRHLHMVVLAVGCVLAGINGLAVAEDVTLDDPNGTYPLGNVDNKSFNLKGTIGTLTIGKVNGQSVITVRRLKAGAIQIGTVDGGSIIKLDLKPLNDNGVTDVTFTDRIDGGSTVTVTTSGDVTVKDRIDSPNTKVTITTCGDINIGQRVDGGSTLIVKMCEDFTVGDRIDNSDTTVNVTHYGTYKAKKANGNVTQKQVQKPNNCQ